MEPQVPVDQPLGYDVDPSSTKLEEWTNRRSDILLDILELIEMGQTYISLIERDPPPTVKRDLTRRPLPGLSWDQLWGFQHYRRNIWSRIAYPSFEIGFGAIHYYTRGDERYNFAVVINILRVEQIKFIGSNADSYLLLQEISGRAWEQFGLFDGEIFLNDMGFWPDGLAGVLSQEALNTTDVHRMSCWKSSFAKEIEGESGGPVPPRYDIYLALGIIYRTYFQLLDRINHPGPEFDALAFGCSCPDLVINRLFGVNADEA